MIKKRWISGLVFSVVAATAQTPSQTAYRGQSWLGLLVSPSCTQGNKGSTARSKADRESDLTTSGRTATPAVDDAGTRGSSNTASGSKLPGSKLTVPKTGDVTAKNTSPEDPGWGPARKQAQSLSAGCELEANATQFALLLPDGRLLQFDELANQAITKRMPASSAGANSGKILRVSVQGKLQNGKIALDTIQM